MKTRQEITLIYDRLLYIFKKNVDLLIHISYLLLFHQLLKSYGLNLTLSITVSIISDVDVPAAATAAAVDILAISSAF